MRRASRATVVATLMLAVLALLQSVLPAAASAATSAAAGPYAVGDSVMLGARTQLLARGFSGVNAVKSRQAYVAPALLRKRAERLPHAVVVHLGTNGSIPMPVCRRMVDAVGPGHVVFLLTVHVPRRWQKADNDVIRRCAAAYPARRVRVIDWDAAASAHPGWLYADRTHLTPAGAAGYARLLARETAAIPSGRTSGTRES